MRQLKINQRFTTRDSLALEKYFKEVSKEAPITGEEETMLAKRIRMGDMQALDTLVRANLRFVISVAKQYEGFGMHLEDLISEGNIGLMKAARRFDESKGYKFISYAVFWIRQCILKSLNENARIIRVPSNQLSQMQKLHSTFSRLEQTFGREPSAEELALELDLTPAEVNKVLMQSQAPVSIDRPIGSNEDDVTLLERLKNEAEAPDEELMKDSVSQELTRCLDRLNVREAEVIRMHFGLDGRMPLKFEEIAEAMGLGKERVRQLKVQGIRKLQKLTQRSGLLSKI
ncbi:sigma-70 family RNA polymerase sigma factor [soil metagenome]